MCIECRLVSVTTCSCVGLFDIQLFGSEARFSDGGAWRKAAGIKTPRKQRETQHNHLQRDKHKEKKKKKKGGERGGRGK